MLNDHSAGVPIWFVGESGKKRKEGREGNKKKIASASFENRIERRRKQIVGSKLTRDYPKDIPFLFSANERYSGSGKRAGEAIEKG